MQRCVVAKSSPCPPNRKLRKTSESVLQSMAFSLCELPETAGEFERNWPAVHLPARLRVYIGGRKVFPPPPVVPAPVLHYHPTNIPGANGPALFETTNASPPRSLRPPRGEPVAA